MSEMESTGSGARRRNAIHVPAPSNSQKELAQVETRALGGGQRFMLMMDRVAPNNICAVLLMRGPISERMLGLAVRRVQERHPLLRARVSGKPHRAAFSIQPCDNSSVIPLRVVGRPPTAWLETTEEELATQFDLSCEPPIRVALMGADLRRSDEDQRFALVVTVNHVVTDARAMATIVRDLLRSLSAIHRGEDGSLERRPVPPRAENFMPAGMKGTARLAWLLREQALARRLAKQVGRPVNVIRVSKQSDPDTWRARIEPMVIPGEETAALRALCRKERTTLHGLLSAAQCKAMLPELDGHGSEISRLRFATTVDIRPGGISPLLQDVEVYTSMVSSLHRVCAKTPIWDLAREIGNQVHDSIARGVPFFVLGLLGSVAGRSFMFARPGDRQGQRRRLEILSKLGGAGAATCLSNVGRVELNDVLGPYRIDGIYGCPAAPSSAPVAGVALGYDSRLYLTFAYLDPLVTQARVRSILARMKDELHMASADLLAKPKVA